MSYPHFSADCHEHHGLVRDFGGPRPPIVVLCGSTRFRDEFAAVNRDLTNSGAIVVAPGVFGHSGDPFTEEEKTRLDDLHKRKIDLADEVFVVNVNGYVGDSTRSEIEYAEKAGKPIAYLEPQRTWHTIVIQRACNGCSRDLRDASEAELDAAVAGDRLPDVRSECPDCAPALAAETAGA
jgi:dienelactone hydrolase